MQSAFHLTAFIPTSVFEASQSLFWASFGMVGLENFELAGIKSYTRFWGLLMFGSYSVINVIVLLNLLIAMMSNSYAMITVSMVVKVSKRQKMAVSASILVVVKYLLMRESREVEEQRYDQHAFMIFLMGGGVLVGRENLGLSMNPALFSILTVEWSMLARFVTWLVSNITLVSYVHIGI